MTFEDSAKRVEVTALELEPPLVLEADTSVRDVIHLMRESGLGYALLTQKDRLVGILTERDVLHKLIGVEGALEQPVSQLMQPDPDSVLESDPVRKAAFLMQEKGYRNIPVVDARHHVIGCVRHKDIIRYLVEHLADHVLSLPPDPDQVASTAEGG